MGDSEKIEKDHNKSVNFYIKRNVGEHFFTKCLPLAFFVIFNYEYHGKSFSESAK